MMVVITQPYTFIKFHRIAYLKEVKLTNCKLYLNIPDLKRKGRRKRGLGDFKQMQYIKFVKVLTKTSSYKYIFLKKIGKI